MAIAVVINNIDRTTGLGGLSAADNAQQFTLQQGARGACTITLNIKVGNILADPQEGQSIKLFDQGICIFLGDITSVERQFYDYAGNYNLTLTGESWERRLDRHLISPRLYQNMTAGQIVTDLMSNVAGNESIGGYAVSTGVFLANPAPGDTLTIGTTTYTFVAGLSEPVTVPNEILIGANFAVTLGFLEAAVNGGTGQGLVYSIGTVTNTLALISAVVANSFNLTATQNESAGNSVATSATGVNITFPGPTLTGGVGVIDDGAFITDIVFDNTTLTDAIQQLADASDFVWYVNPHDAGLYFVAPATTNAPFQITNANRNALWDSGVGSGGAGTSGPLDIVATLNDYRNRQKIRISFTAFAPEADYFTGDGATTQITLRKPVNAIVAITQTVATPASASGALSALPANGDTVTIGPITYTFTTPNVGTPVFVGSGLNDLSASGTFTGLDTDQFRIVIDGVGATDTFEWSNNNGATWNAQQVPITGTPQALTDGVFITFGAITGHTFADSWTFDGTPTVDNTIPFQVAIGADVQGTGRNLTDAINAQPARDLLVLEGGIGAALGYSLPSWANPAAYAVHNPDFTITLVAKQPGQIGNTTTISAVGAFAWTTPTLVGGTDAGTTADVTQSFGVQGVDVNKDWYYTQGSPVITASPSAPATGNVVFTGAAGLSPAVFTGSGLNDLTVSGSYTGALTENWIIQIDSNGTPDTFEWSNDGGTTFTTTVPITGAAQLLADGVSVTFAATTGHTIGDDWTFTATAAGLNDLIVGGSITITGTDNFVVTIDATGMPDTFSWTVNGGGGATGVAITGGVQNLQDGITVQFGATTGHNLGQSWAFTASAGLAPAPGATFWIQYRPLGGDVLACEHSGLIEAQATLENSSGLYENLSDVTQLTDPVATDPVAAVQRIVALLNSYSQISLQLMLVTDQPGLAISQMLTVALDAPFTPSNGQWLIQEIQGVYIPNFPAWRYTVTALGIGHIGTWLQFWIQLALTGGNQGGSSSTTTGAAGVGSSGGSSGQPTQPAQLEQLVYQCVFDVGDNGVVVATNSNLDIQKDAVVFTQWLMAATDGTPVGDTTFDVVDQTGASIFDATKAVLPGGTAPFTIVRGTNFANTPQTLAGGSMLQGLVVAVGGTPPKRVQLKLYGTIALAQAFGGQNSATMNDASNSGNQAIV